MEVERGSSSSDQAESEECFQEWMKAQEESQRELLEALHAAENRVNSNSNIPKETERELTKLVDKSIEQFEDYIDRRTQLAKKDVSAFFAFSVTGLDLEKRMLEFLKRMKSVEELVDLSPEQMEKLDDLRMRTIKEEERVTSEHARVQEEIAEQTVVEMIANRSVKEPNEELERALEKQDGEMVRIIEEADKLRMRTLNEITEILRPLQAVRFLALGKKLHLCVREWGKRCDQKHGRDGIR